MPQPVESMTLDCQFTSIFAEQQATFPYCNGAGAQSVRWHSALTILAMRKLDIFQIPSSDFRLCIWKLECSSQSRACWDPFRPALCVSRQELARQCEKEWKEAFNINNDNMAMLEVRSSRSNWKWGAFRKVEGRACKQALRMTAK